MLIHSIKIFIGRPDEASSEDENIKSVCEQLNEIGQESFVLKALTYKDISPGVGQPQKIINKEASKCEIIVLVLKRDVGAKGFKAEINLGLRRWKKDKVPVLLYAYDLPDLTEKEKHDRNKLLDPIKNKFLYSSIKTPEEFKVKLEKHLYAEVKKIIEKKSNLKDNAQLNVSNSGQKPKRIKKIKLKDKIDKKNNLLSVLEKVRKSLSTKIDLDQFEKARLYLHASSLLFYSEIESEILDNHTINLLYKHREKVILVKEENELILRSVIGDVHQQKTGWYWLKNFKNIDFLIDYCWYLLNKDLSDEVKTGALELIDNFWKEKDCVFLKKSSQISSTEIKLKIINILNKHPSNTALEIIESMIKDSVQEVVNEANHAKLIILTAIDIHRAIEMVISDSEIASSNINEKIYKEANITELHRLLNHKKISIKENAFKELNSRGQFTHDQLFAYIKDDEYSIKFLAIKSLVEKKILIVPQLIRNLLKSDKKPFLFGEIYNEDEILRMLYEKTENVKLKNYIELGVDGDLAYEVYALRNWETFKSNLRGDLKDSFKNLLIELTAKMASELKITVKEVENMYRDLYEYIANQFITSALKVLLIKGDESDKLYAYKYLDKDTYIINSLCKNILVKKGGKDDAQFLFNLSTQKNNKDSKVLISALNLDIANQLGLIDKGIKSKDEFIFKTILSYCLRKKIILKKELEEEIEKQLYHKNYEIRKLVMAYILNTRSSTRLTTLLVNYYSATNYFYNIVSYLDVVLYAHRKIRIKLKEELTNELLEISK